MRLFDGDVTIEPLSDGGLRVVFKARTGEVVAADVSGNQINEFRRAVVLPSRGEHLNMSQIKKVTEFLRTDMPELNKTASDLHERATQVKIRAGAILDGASLDLDDLEKEIAELESEMRQGSNFPPKEEAQ